MGTQLQAIALILVILISVALTNRDEAASSTKVGAGKRAEVVAMKGTGEPSLTPTNVSFERAAVIDAVGGVRRVPKRIWEVSDPALSARAALAYSLDDEFTLWGAAVEVKQPIASIVKLLTAITVRENLGENKKVAMNETAVAMDGEAGGLQSGEVYSALDLLKIMLLTSSNDAAAAFAEHRGGERVFVREMQEKAEKIGMFSTRVEEPAGLSTSTVASPSDLLRLMRYLLGNHPEVLAWTRTPGFLVQPLNDPTSRLIQNINPFVTDTRFLGGKTGTLNEAGVGENLMAVFSIENRRVVLILLGSANRVKDTNALLDWIGKAYTF